MVLASGREQQVRENTEVELAGEHDLPSKKGNNQPSPVGGQGTLPEVVSGKIRLKGGEGYRKMDK